MGVMRRLGPRSFLFNLATVLCLLTASCGLLSDSNDDGQVTTTLVADPDEEGQAGDPISTTSTTMTETTVATLPDLTDVAWVVNDFDGLVDDQGRTIAPLTDMPASSRPSVLRAGDGSIYYVLDGKLWRRAVDAPEPTAIETEASDISDVDRDGDGNIIVNRHDEPEVVVEGATFKHPDTIADGADGSITASNGITVRILPPDADVDDRGYVTEFRSPARLEVERDGVTEWTIDAGGVTAPWLSLVDFDGRFVMMVRYPTEPADPMMQHIVYDLDCPGGDIVGSGCTRTFWARWGTAALVGPDVDSADLNTELLDICPTMGALIDPPAEMTDPASFDEDFTDDDLEAFRLAALQLTTCDPNGLGDPERPGLLHVAGSDDPDEHGWMWAGFADALRGPFTQGPRNTYVWSRHRDGPLGVLDRSRSPSRLDLQPGRRFADDLAVTVTSESLLVFGRTDADTAEAVLAAAQSVADERGARLSDWVDRTGTAHRDGLVAEFVATIQSDLGAGTVGEIHLTTDGVVGNLTDRSGSTLAQRNLGFLVADFASGGEGVYDELPLADDIVMALGPEVVARRQPTELFRRSAWVVNSSEFAGRVGPFNLLDLVPSPLQIAVGPHARCAGPEAVPSPPELVAYTRIGILPLEGSIDSCLDWSAVDLFVDDEGVIRGLALHLEAP